LGTRRKWSKKPLVFIGVLFLHGAVVLLLARMSQQFRASVDIASEPLVFLLLHKAEPAPSLIVPPGVAPVSRAPRRNKAPQPAQPQLPNNAITLPPPAETGATPPIDWAQEAQLAAQNGLENTDKERHYRNLGGPSYEQLKWVRDNKLVQMNPGIVWKHPRVEVDKDTLMPIVHLNDHCVWLPVFPLPLCTIGHIKGNSHLFDHMHDAPPEP
jgi:hypothetical protein